MIVEDDPLLLQNLELLLGGERNIDVVGAHRSAEEALEFLDQAKPEVLLVDLGLPGMDGLEFIRKTREKLPEAEIMVHTVFEDRATVFAALKAGATGYVLKGATPRELVESLHSQYRGGVPMSPRIARAVIQEFRETGPQEDYLLTPREREILKGVEEGYTYQEIARKCRISRHTVHAHIKKIYEKLHARNRQDALLRARRKGLI